MEGFGVFVLVGWFFHEENKAFFLSNLQDSEIFETKVRLSYLKKKNHLTQHFCFLHGSSIHLMLALRASA